MSNESSYYLLNNYVRIHFATYCYCSATQSDHHGIPLTYKKNYGLIYREDIG